MSVWTVCFSPVQHCPESHVFRFLPLLFGPLFSGTVFPIRRSFWSFIFRFYIKSVDPLRAEMNTLEIVKPQANNTYDDTRSRYVYGL